MAAIYLDAVWLLNFLLDYMLLLLTNKLARLHTNLFRLAFGAFIASLIVPFSVYYPESFVSSAVGKMLFSIIIILISFRFLSFRHMLKLLFLFYFITFSIGGGLIALHFIAQQPITVSQTGIFTFNSGYGDPISWIFVIIGFPVVWFFTKRRMDKHVQDKIKYDMEIQVTLTLKGDSHSTKGLIDSGNMLTCPFSKKPVIICDETFLMNWFEKTEWEQMKSSYEKLDMDLLPERWVDSLRIIPYQGVEGGNGFMFTIYPEEMRIVYDGKEIRTTDFLVGIQFGKLTREGNYHCLLHPELIQSAIHYSA